MKASKAEWLERLAKLAKNPRPLTPTECVELAALLGGGKPHRPVKLTAKGEHERLERALALADLVFEYDGVSRSQAELMLATELGCADPKRAAKAMQNELSWLRERLGIARLDAKSWTVYKIQWLQSKLDRLPK
jgi:hypothetical protein